MLLFEQKFKEFLNEEKPDKDTAEVLIDLLKKEGSNKYLNAIGYGLDLLVDNGDRGDEEYGGDYLEDKYSMNDYPSEWLNSETYKELDWSDIKLAAIEFIKEELNDKFGRNDYESYLDIVMRNSNVDSLEGFYNHINYVKELMPEDVLRKLEGDIPSFLYTFEFNKTVGEDTGPDGFDGQSLYDIIKYDFSSGESEKVGKSIADIVPEPYGWSATVDSSSMFEEYWSELFERIDGGPQAILDLPKVPLKVFTDSEDKVLDSEYDTSN
tara:strand:+ start:128 stop:928 length:801 start_codon:yes stop_codon:yes gene_type:complete